MGSHLKLHPKWCSSPTDLSTKGQCDLSFPSLQCSKSIINFNKPLGFDLNMLSLGEWIHLSKSYFHWLIWKSIFTANQWYAAEKAMAPHSSTLAWEIPWMEEPGGLQSMGSLRVGHDWVTSLSFFTLMHWRRKWQPTPVFLPWESQGRGSLVGCRLWLRTESDTTEVT